MAPLTKDEIAFMRALLAGADDLPLADLAGDRARRRLVRLGYAEFDRKLWRWRPTEYGRAAWHTRVVQQAPR